MMLELQSDCRIDENQASSSFVDKQIKTCSSAELAQWLHNDRQQVVLLDCRPSSENNTSFAGAQKILLPTVLMRRLQNGTLAPGSLAPQLAEQTDQVRVILIPDKCDNDVMASKVYKMLVKKKFDVFCFEDEPEEFARHFPTLIESTSYAGTRKKAGLNLCLLTDKFSENVIKPSADRGFPAKIFHCVYLGNDDTAKNRELLKRFGIDYVINVTSDLPNYYETDGDFHYLRIPVDDSHSHNLAKYFPGMHFYTF
ncbi:unnamed protein product [Bursaphelenchus okinawaensis]|uniref:protein-tyrosine-phosphatase n=1 Tax=Bursaphelenchus okinawaensis TaxID=465554 RepID=A0A811KXE2_9BILA|nr:unnamed protein product [Bursaphelenchus okinawaensis]CAG9113799.1 unnamed protein product [Bursaphelenchus okinawaensis]